MNRGVAPDRGAAPAVVDRAAELRHRIRIGDVHRGEGRRAALRLDPVVQILEPADGAGDGDDVMGLGKRLGEGEAQAARGAGDECDGL